MTSLSYDAQRNLRQMSNQNDSVGAQSICVERFRCRAFVRFSSRICALNMDCPMVNTATQYDERSEDAVLHLMMHFMTCDFGRFIEQEHCGFDREMRNCDRNDNESRWVACNFYIINNYYFIKFLRKYDGIAVTYNFVLWLDDDNAFPCKAD